MALLIDSSVWIAAQFSSNRECLLLKRMLEADELIYAVRPIQVEVCQGAKSEDEFHQLWSSFLGLEFLEITDKHWGLSAWHYFKCRKEGVTLTTLDCLIATVAREYRVPLWTLDKVFSRIQKSIGFDLYKPPR